MSDPSATVVEHVEESPPMPDLIRTLSQMAAEDWEGRIRPGACSCEECEPGLYGKRWHLPVEPGLVNPAPGTLYHEAHEPLALAKNVIAFISTPAESAALGRDSALDEWTEWRTSAGAAALNHADLSRVDVENIAAPFDIFNRFFFCSSIKNTQFAGGEVGKTLRLNAVAQCTTKLKPVAHTDFHFNAIRREPDEGSSYFDELMSALLHEMVHAFLAQYSCIGERCGMTECKVLARHNFGDSSHGRAWVADSARRASGGC
ncbi:hypothetical protein LTR85_005675 [Meristemomyces frigidus]|nr:hypothetical protein LTR85_005675 [Meristemomyces frigidus]